jgi:hypothetical protein
MTLTKRWFALAALFTFATALAVQTAAVRAADPDWWDATAMRGFRKNVPDFYQHQYNDTDPMWQPNGGWCREVALVDCLYTWKAQGYNGLLDDKITMKNDWLQQSCEEIKKVVGVEGVTGVNQLLKDRGHGQDEAVGTGLVFNQYAVDQTTGKVTYMSSEKDDMGKSVVKTRMVSAFDAYKQELKDGQDVMLRWSAERRMVDGMPLMYDPALWWTYSGKDPMGDPQYKGGSYAQGNYHYVTAAGVDCKTMEIFFADPDTNKGSGAGDAGWTGADGRKYKLPDDMNVPIPTRPADMTKDPNMLDNFYGSAKIGDDGFTVSEGRYKDVRMGAIETICPKKAAVTGRAPTDTGSTKSMLAVDTGIFNDIDSLIFYPTSYIDTSSLSGFSMSSPGDLWSPAIYRDPLSSNPLLALDPDGNTRKFGGVEFDLIPGLSNGFGPSDLGMAMFSTLLPFDGIDVMMRVAGTQNWLVQAVGADETIYGDQIPFVPEPPTWILTAVIALCFVPIRRRRPPDAGPRT